MLVSIDKITQCGHSQLPGEHCMETCNVKYPMTAFMSQCKLCYPFDSTYYHDHVSSAHK